MRYYINNCPYFLVTLMVALTATNVAASNNPFAWDLSYVTLFKENKVPDNDTMLKFFNDAYHKQRNSRDMHLPDELFSEINLASIKIAILVDYQAFWYMGHRSSALFIDDGKSVTARTYNSKNNKINYFETTPAYNVDFSDIIMHRSQSVPLGGYQFQIIEGYSFAGYIGAISRYDANGSSQQLITVEDIINKQNDLGDLGKLLYRAQETMAPIDMQ